MQQDFFEIVPEDVSGVDFCYIAKMIKEKIV